MAITTAPLRQNLKSEAPMSLRLSLGERSTTSSFSSRSSISIKNLVTGEVIKRCFLSVLGECVQEFHTLERIYSSVVELKTIKEIPYLTIQQRFGSSERDYDRSSLGRVYTNVHKLEKIVAATLYLLESCMEEVQNWGTVSIVVETIENLKRMRHEEDLLMQQTKGQIDLLNDMKRALKSEKYINNARKSYDEIIRDIQRSTLDMLEHAKIEVKYVKDWENARYEQNYIVLNNAETEYRETSSQMQTRIATEEACHNQLIKYILDSREEYQQEIEYLMDDYEASLELKEADIFDLKTKVDKQRTAFDDLKALYEQRARFVAAWLEEKRKRKEAAKLLALQIAAVIKIQRWWRTVMVRRKLGPYRKPKEKKGKKGKGKEQEVGIADKPKTAKKGK